MSKGSIDTITCDDCEIRELITDGTKEGKPLYSWLSRGWIKIEHRDPDDPIGIKTTHYCPDCAGNHLFGDRFDV